MVDYINSKSNREDYCVDEILKIVARGSSILAEILRMKDYIPEIYDKADELKKYQNIVFEFTYFEKIDYYEDQIRNSSDLRNLDEEFRDNYFEILERFYIIFNNVYKYIIDLEAYFESVKQGVYVQHTIENMLTSKSARHLICESIYLYGAMLLIIDKVIPGIVRERIIISYYRYAGQSTIKNISEIVKLFQTTGYSSKDNLKPKNYPSSFFSRHPIDRELLKMVIGTIKDNDIYDQIGAYPSPDHRSHALSSQASMLFVMLFFIPDYLDIENSKMREIVDKHFSDNWVLSIYMGYSVDILDYWKDFKSAKSALAIAISPEKVKQLSKENNEKLYSLKKTLEKFYYEGTINEDYVLDNINKLLGIMRDSNVVLKWYLLQLNTTNKKYKEMMEENLNKESLISLLMAISHFEHNLKSMFQKLIDAKERMWMEDKSSCIYRLKELSEYFAGQKNFGKQAKQEDFKDFFEKHMKNLEAFEYKNSTMAGRKIVIMKDELEKIKKYHYVEGNLQIKQYIFEIINSLNHMLRVVNIKNKVLINIAQISDFSYAWITIQDYLPTMQKLLKSDSNNILYLKSVFLKLASILNFPLVRLFEAESPDIESVTNHYSTEIVNLVRNVLQIVPTSVFKILEQIIEIYNKGFKDLPIKILKADIKDFAQLEDRYELAKCVHQISLFTKGILAMEKTLVGIIEVDPKEILEDGIRRELLKLLANEFHKNLDLTSGSIKSDLSKKLIELGRVISSIRRGFIYIQDYINIDGSRIWNEEMHRLINCYTDLEANKFLSKKIKLEPKYNLLKYPMPKFIMPKEEQSLTFLGRLFNYIITITKPKNTTYFHSLFSWYDNNNKEFFSLKSFYIIKDSMGVEGFQGLYRLIGYHNYLKIFNLSKAYVKYVSDKQNLKNLQTISKLIGNPLILEFSEKDSAKNFISIINSLSKGLSSVFFDFINTIGHYELIKSLVQHCLRESVEYESNCLYSQMVNLNKIFLGQLKNFNEIDFNNNEDAVISGDNNQVNKEVKTSEDFFKTLNDVFYDFSLCAETFYQDISKLDYLVLVISVISFSELTLNYSKENNTIIRKNKNEEYNFVYFFLGIKTILFQMGRKNKILYLSVLSNIRRVMLMNTFTLKEIKSMDSKLEIPENLMILDTMIKDIQTSLTVDEKESDLSLGLKIKLS
jgi:WASH complex subunit strumpellin